MSDELHRARLLAGGVPPAVVDYWLGDERVWVAPLRNVRVNGVRVLTVDERAALRGSARERIIHLPDLREEVA
jgi:hypothetical protein